MTILRSTFEWAGELYRLWFADWLHVHFLIRTAILLLALWMAIYLSALLFRYFLAPLALLFFYHIIFRAWNYFFVETPQEWLYIKYHSKDMPNFSALYLRLSDKVKKNRMILSHTKYTGLVIKLRRATTHLMAACLTVVTLWVSAFGLHQEYAEPALVIVDGTAEPQDPPDTPPENDIEPGGETYEPAPEPPDESQTNGQYNIYAPGLFSPVDWPVDSTIILALSDAGSQGARLRDGPGIAGNTVIEIIWDEDRLLYLHSYVPDRYVDGLYWLRVRTPAGTDGYISSQLVEVED